MRFVIVTQTVGEFTPEVEAASLYAQLPSDYPISVTEADYDFLSDAEAANPGRVIYDVPTYVSLMVTLAGQNQGTLDGIAALSYIEPPALGEG